MLRVTCLAALLTFAAVAAACGDGDDSDAATSNQGAAAFAVAEFWRQERDGGVLPEGVELAAIGGQPPKTLAAAGGEDARYCVEFRYRSTADVTKMFTRVYTATLVDDAWQIESIDAVDGTCESVA